MGLNDERRARAGEGVGGFHDPRLCPLRAAIADITPEVQDLPPGTHPFPTKYASRTSRMTFNIADYSRQLMNDFLIAGG
jgi:hypothetical protein